MFNVPTFDVILRKAFRLDILSHDRCRHLYDSISDYLSLLVLLLVLGSWLKEC